MTGTEPTADGHEALEAEMRASDEHLARSLHLSAPELQDTLDVIVRTALANITSADYAGLILVERNELVPQVTLGEPPHELDVLQQRLNRGPCLDAATSQEVTQISDTRTEQRWPEFTERAASLGVRSVMCVPLWVSNDVLGTLSLYSAQASAFSNQDVQPIKLFATHAALALANSRSINHLRTALINRDIIGQAKGILMERLHISADVAFTMLSTASQAKNRKLVEIALDLVETGHLDV